MIWQGSNYTAELKEDGQLYFSDGITIWARMEADAYQVLVEQQLAAEDMLQTQAPPVEEGSDVMGDFKKSLGELRSWITKGVFWSMLLKDYATRTVMINTFMTVLFYKQIYAEAPVICTFYQNGHRVYAAVIAIAILSSPLIFEWSNNLEQSTSGTLSKAFWLDMLSKIFLLKPWLEWVGMVKTYAKELLLVHDRPNKVNLDYLQTRTRWVHGMRQMDAALNRALIPEQYATLVTLVVEFFALFYYISEDSEATKEIGDLKTAIFFSLFTMAVQRTRLDLVGSPLGTVAFKEYVGWSEQQLDYFPVVSGTLAVSSVSNSMAAAAIFLFRLFEPTCVLLSAALLQVSFHSNASKSTFQTLQHCQGVVYLAIFPLAISLLDKRIPEIPSKSAFLNGFVTFPGPLVMAPHAVSPAAAVSIRKYYACRCLQLFAGLFIAIARVVHWELSHTIASVLISVVACYMLFLSAYVLAMFKLNFDLPPAPDSLYENLGIAMMIEQRALPRQLEKFHDFFQDAYGMYPKDKVESAARRTSTAAEALGEELGKNIGIDNFGAEIRDVITCMLPDDTIQVIKISPRPGLMSTFEAGVLLGSLLSKSPQVHTLELNACDLNAKALRGMISTMPRDNKIKIILAENNEGQYKYDILANKDQASMIEASLLSTAEGGAAMGSFLAKCAGAEELHVANSGLNAEGLHAMLSMMPQENQIKVFKTKGGYREQTDLMSTAGGGAVMGKLLCTCARIEQLELVHFALNEEGLRGMISTMPQDNQIKTFVAQDCGLMSTAGGGEAMGSFLSTCARVEVLDLESTGLNAEALHGMISTMPEDNKISTIKAGFQKGLNRQQTSYADGTAKGPMETSEGGAAMGLLISKCKGTVMIDLDNSGITAQGLHAMISTIPQDNKIKVIKTSENYELMSTIEGGVAMGSLLSKCPAAQELHLSDTVSVEGLHGMISTMPQDNKIKMIDVRTRRMSSIGGFMKTAAAGAALGSLVSKCPGVESLHLDYLHVEGLRGMNSTMPQHTKIKNLNYLFGNGLLSTCEGGVELGAFWSKCPEVEKLHLRALDVKAEGFRGMLTTMPQDSKAKSIILGVLDDKVDLMSTAGGGSAMASFLSKCANVEELHWDEVIPKGSAGQVARCLCQQESTLEVVELVPPMAEGLGIFFLDLLNITSLIADPTYPESMDSYLSFAWQCPRLEVLSISNPLKAHHFADESFTMLQDTNIKSIDLQGVGDFMYTFEGGAAIGSLLSKCPQAQKLNIGLVIQGGDYDGDGTNEINAEGFHGMVTTMPRENNIKILDFEGNENLLAQPGSGADVGLLLSKCPLVEQLNVQKTNLTEEQLRAMVAAMPQDHKIKIINASYQGYNQDWMVTAGAGAAMGSLFSKCAEAEELNLQSTGLNLEALQAMISTMPQHGKIKTINASYNFSGLRFPMEGEDNDNALMCMAEGGAAMGCLLTKCAQVEELNFDSTGLNAEGLHGMMTTLPQENKIKTVKASENWNLMSTTDSGAKMGSFLFKCPVIEELNLIDTGLRAEGLQGMISTMPQDNKIRVLTFGNEMTTAGVDGQVGICTPEAGEAMGLLLSKCTAAEELVLSDAKLNVESLHGIVTKMPQETKIKFINVGNNPGLMCAAAGGAAMGSLLSKCAGLEELNLENTDLKAEGLQEMISVMPQDNKIKIVNTGNSGTCFPVDLMSTAEGGAVMGSLLSKCAGMETLDLWAKGVNAEGLQGMISTMPRDNCIKNIRADRLHDLMNTAAGGVAMGSLVSKCSQVQCVLLYGPISAQCLLAMIAKMPSDMKIENVFIADDPYSPTGAGEIGGVDAIAIQACRTKFPACNLFTRASTPNFDHILREAWPRSGSGDPIANIMAPRW